MVPVVGGIQDAAGDDFQGILGPLVDDVHANLAALVPEVPTGVARSGFHAGGNRTGLGPRRELDPGSDREGLLGSKITHVVQLDRGAGLDGERLGGQLAVFPGEAVLQVDRPRLAGDGQVDVVALFLIQRCVEGQPGRGKAGREVLGLDLGEPLIKVSPGIVLAGGRLLLILCDLFRDHRITGTVLGFRNRDDRRGVVDVAVHGPLRGVVEKSRQGVKVLRRDRIELVVVTDGTTGGQAHPDG